MQPQTSPSERQEPHASLASTVGSIAGAIGSDGFPTGERAALRRISPALPPPIAFYRFAFRHLPDGWESDPNAWLAIVAGIAIMSPHAHDPYRPVGRALAEARYSENRLERLLSSEGSMLHTLMLRTARFLASKNDHCNWVDFAKLLLTRDSDKKEAVRLNIARDFYRNNEKKEKEG